MQESGMVQKLSEADSIDISRDDILDCLFAILPQTSAIDRFANISVRKLRALIGAILEYKWEFAAYLPNKYEYTPTALNDFGPLHILYKQASSIEQASVDIDNNYFDNTWSKNRPAHSESLNTYFQLAYDENTDGNVTDMLGVRNSELLEQYESVSIYVSPSNTEAPSNGTVTPDNAWKLHNPATDTTSQSAYYTLRKAFEPVFDTSEIERDTDTHASLVIGTQRSNWRLLPFSIDQIDDEIKRFLMAIVGRSTKELPLDNTRYNYSRQRSETEDSGVALNIIINGNNNIFSYDIPLEDMNKISAGEIFTLSLEVVNGIGTITGAEQKISLIIVAGSKNEEFFLSNESNRITFELPTENVAGITISARGSWTGGRPGGAPATGYILITHAELRSKGSQEDLLDDWFDVNYDKRISEYTRTINIPTDLAYQVIGQAGTIFRDPSPLDIRDRHITTQILDTGALQVTGRFIAVKFLGVGGTVENDPVITENLGSGYFRYTGPVNRPLFRIAIIPNIWELGLTVQTVINGVEQSIASKLTEFENLLHQQAQDVFSTAIENFHKKLTQRHVSGTEIVPPSAEDGFIIAAIGILGDNQIAKNELLSEYSKVVLTSPSQLDSEFKLHAPLFSNYADIGLEKVIISGWVDLSRDTGFQVPFLRVGYLTSIGVRDILRIDVHGVLGWNTRVSATGDRDHTYDQTVPTTAYHEYGFYDNTALKQENWDIDANVNTVKATLNLTENDNPMRADVVINIDTTQDRALANQTINFTDQSGNTRSVVIRWSYTLSSRRLLIQSGASNLPAYSEYQAAGHVTIDRLKITITKSVTTTVYEREQTAFVPVNPVSGTGISTSSENAYFVIMQFEKLANGNAQGSIVTKEMTSGTVISYTRQDLGIPYDEFDFARLRIFDFRLTQWDTSVFYPSRDVFTDSELRSKATASAYGLGEVTKGSVTEYDFDEFVLGNPLSVPKLFVGGDEVLTTERNELVVLPFTKGSDVDSTLTGDDATDPVGAAWWIMDEGWENLGYNYISIITHDTADSAVTYTDDGVNYHPLQDSASNSNYIDNTHHLADFIEIASRDKTRQGRQTFLRYNKDTRRLDTVSITGGNVADDVFMKITLHY